MHKGDDILKKIREGRGKRLSGKGGRVKGKIKEGRKSRGREGKGSVGLR